MEWIEIMSKRPKLIDEREYLLSKWRYKGLWIWEKKRLDNIDNELAMMDQAIKK